MLFNSHLATISMEIVLLYSHLTINRNITLLMPPLSNKTEASVALVVSKLTVGRAAFSVANEHRKAQIKP